LFALKCRLRSWPQERSVSDVVQIAPDSGHTARFHFDAFGIFDGNLDDYLRPARRVASAGEDRDGGDTPVQVPDDCALPTDRLTRADTLRGDPAVH